MSFRKERIAPLEGFTSDNYVADKSAEEIKQAYQKILDIGVHGFCFSAYEDGQRPGDIISEAQIRRRMSILNPHTEWIRTFSCTEGNELIARIAKEYGKKTLVGAWLGNDDEKNKAEIEALIQMAGEGLIDIAAVGNEVLYRKDLTEEQLLEYIYAVKKEIPNIPVGYVDAYYEFAHRPKIAEACDVILCNCYPYWEGCSFEHSLAHMKQMYWQAKNAGGGKETIITETGWPSQGESLRGAIPSAQNALEYFINTQMWSLEDDIPVFYFSSFDESWKTGAEGEVGAYWGIWDKNENLKFQ